MIDQTIPTIGSIQPQGTITYHSPVISAVLSDDLSGINRDSIQLRLNGAVVSNDFIALDGNVLTYTPPSPLEDGPYTINIELEDNAGNSTTAIQSFLIDSSLMDGSNPLNQPLDEGAIRLVEASSETFYNLALPLKFSLSGSEFEQDLSEVALTINGELVSNLFLTLSPNMITATPVLVDGRNEISLSAVDIAGRPLYFRATLWAGSENLAVDLVDPDDLTINDAVTVRAYLTDDPSFFAETTTTTGTVVFQNMPDHTLVIRTTTGDNRLGFSAVSGWQDDAKIRLTGFHEPAPSITTISPKAPRAGISARPPFKSCPIGRRIPRLPVIGRRQRISYPIKPKQESIEASREEAYCFPEPFHYPIQIPTTI